MYFIPGKKRNNKHHSQVWRFPYLAYKNGGGAFLVPYFLILILVGKPMYYMETAFGQFARLSPLQIWRCAPIATGVGVGMLVLCSIIAIYYNVIMAYSIIIIKTRLYCEHCFGEEEEEEEEEGERGRDVECSS